MGLGTWVKNKDIYKRGAGHRVMEFVSDLSKLTSFLNINTDYVCEASKVK